MFEDTVLSWPEAEAAFRERLAISAEEFAAISSELRGTAWTISRIAEHQTLLRVTRKLQQLIESGGTLAEFSKWIDSGQAIVWSDAYTELVFRMATLGAYSQARWDEINDPDVVDEFPLIMYDAVNDDRTRDEHGALDGMTWPLDEFPGEWWPPNGFNCRCETRNMNEDLRRRAGGKIQDGPAPGNPDEGFQSNQALDWNEQLTQELAGLRGELGT
jgi:SPP1 gp7 family putative phage head morphogenesis protein